MCEGPDLNRRTPARTDLESVAFDRAWLPSLKPFEKPDIIINIRSASLLSIDVPKCFGRKDDHQHAENRQDLDRSTSEALLPNVISSLNSETEKDLRDEKI